MRRILIALSFSAFVYNAFSTNVTREIALELVHNSVDIVVIPTCYNSIDDSAFKNLSFNTLVIPGSVKIIKHHAFDHCDFQYVIIKEGVEKIESEVFANNNDAFKILLPVSIKSISFDSFENSVVDIYSDNTLIQRFNGFEDINVYKLRDAIQNEWWKNIQYDKKLFKQRPLVKKEVEKLCVGCEQLDIPEDYTIIGKFACSDEDRLITVNVHDAITRINTGAFFGCLELKKVYLSRNLTRIEDDVFSCCISLENIYIPNSVKYIGKNAFSNCTALKTMRIPAHFNVDYREFVDIINNRKYIAVYFNDIHIGRFYNLTIRQSGNVTVIMDGCLKDEINV